MSPQAPELYTVMQMNRSVADVGTDGRCVVHSPDLMPYNLYLEETAGTTDFCTEHSYADDIDTRLNNLENFYHWCSSRVLTLDRKYAKEILNSIGRKQAVTDRDRADIAITYHGLTLTDSFWIRRCDENVSFEDINLYDHPLSDAFVDVALKGKQLTAQNSELLDRLDAAGDIGTLGLSPKAWIRRAGTFYLLKDGKKRDVEAELLASRILDCFAVEHVQYSEDIFAGVKVSRSKLITSKEKSIVPFEYVEVFAANHDTDGLSLVRKYDNYSYCMMNIVDYLVGNVDRHWGNWGLLVDNLTNEPMKLHPLMDFNRSFESYDRIDGARCLTVHGTVSQKDAAVEAVRQIGLNQTADIPEEWFTAKTRKKMFFRRLEILKAAEKSENRSIAAKTETVE